MRSAIGKVWLFILILLGLAAACHSEDGVTESEILLGQSAAFKGAAAGLGTELWRGAQAFFDRLNAAGGVHGRKIRVLSLDDGYEGDVTLPNTIRLANTEKVFALFGYVGTPTLVKALPAIQKYSGEGLFLFSDFSGAQPQREAPHNKYVFNVRASYRQETASLVRLFVDELGYKKIGLFIQDDAYGRSGADGTSRALQAKGLAPVMETTYQRNTPYSTSMADQVKALQAAGAEAVIAVGAYGQCAAFVRDARAAGWQVPIANLSFVGADALLSKLAEEEKSSGRKLMGHLLNSQVVPCWSNMSYPLVAEYRRAIDEAKTPLPADLKDPAYQPAKYSFASMEGYLNARVLAAVLERAPKNLTRKAFVSAAESMSGLDVGLGERKASFSMSRHQALDAVFLTVPKDGAWVPLKDPMSLK
jgi:ABC-type branched-subunit amino acid transport system substrate-binding protein